MLLGLWLASTNDGLISPAVLAAVVAAIAAIIGAWLTYRSSSRANAVQDRKVSIEDFDAQQERYRKLLAEQDRVIEKIQAQMDRLQDQLAREQEVASTLRSHIRTLQGEIDDLQRRQSAALHEISELRRNQA